MTTVLLAQLTLGLYVASLTAWIAERAAGRPEKKMETQYVSEWLRLAMGFPLLALLIWIST